ncbi:dexamethasone-induced transcript [Mus musculus]|nr:dexamethasone-induced transcript [Mus musculus]
MWASSSCPRTWTRRWWTSAYFQTLALAFTMPTQSLTSSMDIWNNVVITVPHLPSTIRNSWPGPAARTMPLPLVGGTIWTGMGPQEEARLLMPTTGFLPQPRCLPGEMRTRRRDRECPGPPKAPLACHPALHCPGSGCDSPPL